MVFSCFELVYLFVIFDGWLLCRLILASIVLPPLQVFLLSSDFFLHQLLLVIFGPLDTRRSLASLELFNSGLQDVNKVDCMRENFELV